MPIGNVLGLTNKSQMNDIAKQWDTWTPTLTWSTATPVSITTIAKYKQIGKTIFFSVSISSTNGNGATAVKVSLPIIPKTNNLNAWFVGRTAIANASTARSFRVRDDGVSNNLDMDYFVATAGAGAFEISMSGFYEVA